MGRRKRSEYHMAMPSRDGAEQGSRARSVWRTGRPTRWRATSDAMLRRREGVGEPGEAGPDVVEEFLRERLLCDHLSGAGDEPASGDDRDPRD